MKFAYIISIIFITTIIQSKEILPGSKSELFQFVYDDATSPLIVSGKDQTLKLKFQVRDYGKSSTWKNMDISIDKSPDANPDYS